MLFGSPNNILASFAGRTTLWMLKVLNGIIHFNKEPLFLKVYIGMCEGHCNNLMNLSWNGKILWKLKVLH